MIVLSADVGGTKTIIQLVIVELYFDSPRIHVIQEKYYASSDFASFTELIKDFLKGCNISQYPQAACISVAGPIEDTGISQKSKLTNLTWELDSIILSNELKIEKVKIINDFEAIAYGVGFLDESNLTTIQSGIPLNKKNRLVVGAGTGLGVCLLVWDGNKYKAVPTEGGHIGFSPSNDDQDYIHQALRKIFGRTSIERIVSGPGLENIYKSLCDKYVFESEFSEGEKDLAAAIAKLAFKQCDSMAAKALTLFIQCYGSFIGDTALSCFASGGVFMAGGIAPKILWRLTQPDFINSINSKGRMERIVKDIPIWVVLNQKVGLIGSTLVAANPDFG